MTEKQFAHPIKAFQTDNGTEFINEKTDNLLQKHEIRFDCFRARVVGLWHGDLRKNTALTIWRRSAGWFGLLRNDSYWQ